jgi:hypothetical protein
MNAISQVGTAKRRPLTAEHLEPWNGNVVDVTMADGSHRIGLLDRIDQESVHLRASAGVARLPNDGVIRIADAIAINRASRN